MSLTAGQIPAKLPLQGQLRQENQETHDHRLVHLEEAKEFLSSEY